MRLKKKNFADINGQFKINYIHKNVIKKYNTIFATCDPDIFRKFISTGRVFIGLSSSSVFEDFGISKCKKCCNYGHTIKHCRNQNYVCSYCAGEHKTDQCQNKQSKKCVNCCESNNTYKTNYALHHHAHDLYLCKIYNKLKLNKIKLTKY